MPENLNVGRPKTLKEQADMHFTREQQAAIERGRVQYPDNFARAALVAFNTGLFPDDNDLFKVMTHTKDPFIAASAFNARHPHGGRIFNDAQRIALLDIIIESGDPRAAYDVVALTNEFASVCFLGLGIALPDGRPGTQRRQILERLATG